MTALTDAELAELYLWHATGGDDQIQPVRAGKIRALLAEVREHRVGWLPMDTAPLTEPMKKLDVLVWSPQLGVQTGTLHRWKDSPATVNVSGFHGDAVANWGVTHWRPMLAGPVAS